MKIYIKKFLYFFTLLLTIPLLATMLIKPGEALQPSDNETKNKKTGINAEFKVIIKEDKGIFEYYPEDMVQYMVAAIMRWDMVADASDEDGATVLEYIKSLCVVCRTNLVRVWQESGCPSRLDYHTTNLSEIYLKDNNIDYELICGAVEATQGVVITDKTTQEVIAAPFFTSDSGDLLARQTGNGQGLSLNYAFIKAQEGMDFVDILLFFYVNVGLDIL